MYSCHRSLQNRTCKSDDSHFSKSVDQEEAHTSIHLPAPYPNLATIANKISSVISRIMIAEKNHSIYYDSKARISIEG